MRYYIYLDKAFLRILFSVKDTSNLEIEVVEYSIKRSFSKSNDIGFEPNIEKNRENENDSMFKFKDDMQNRKRKSNHDRQRLAVSYNKSNSSNIQTERKYINIEDISQMKNTAFYHKLIEEIRSNSRESNNRIYEETGYITLYNENTRDINISDGINENDGFFRIDDTCIWYDRTLLQGNISLLSKMSCKIKVIGYVINCTDNANKKIVKAIAMYID